MSPPRLQERLAFGRVDEPNGLILMGREGRPEDVADCFVLLQSLDVPYVHASRRLLVDMWRMLISNGTMNLFLVENRAKPAGSRVVSFNTTLFVTDSFCSEAQSTLPPYLGAEIARHYLTSKWPGLTREQVARANASDGLNVMMCFGAWKCTGFSRDQFLAMCEKQSETLRLGLSGYRVKEFLADPIEEQTLQWMLNDGVRLRRGYPGYFGRRRQAISRIPPRPWLVGLTKDEAFADPGSRVAGLFFYTPPRFHFQRSEKILLRHALMGETDQALAGSLFISPWTVKKRWHAIYQRVADVDREMLPQPMGDGSRATSRGAERRRHLLNYLRQHPEELRPFDRQQNMMVSASPRHRS